MLACRGIRVSYGKGDQRIFPLRDVSLEVDNQPCAVMGPSGSGKSTLLRVLAGLQKPDAGDVLLDGAPIDSESRIAMIHQDYRLVDFLTVGENLQLAAEMRGIKLSETAVDDALEQVALAGTAKRRPTTLSGGEQQRVAIARAVATQSSLILADEPTGALDLDNTLAIGALLSKLGADRGMTVVVATHDLDLAELLPRRLLLSEGRLSEQTTPIA
jgi:putative ABC transport system ATP-binding protein